MYFWNIEKLKGDLANNSVSERDYLKYLIATTILYTLSGIPYFDANYFDVLSLSLSLPISVLGIIYAYKLSNKHNFLGKFIPISWVVTVRMVPFVIVVAFFIAGFIPEETTEWDVSFIAIIELIFYWRIGHHIQRT